VYFGKLVYGDNNQLIAEMLRVDMAGLQFLVYFGLCLKTMLVVLGIILKKIVSKRGYD
jgi:hypothetical protein